jgi:uncharacterized membrane protein YgcG
MKTPIYVFAAVGLFACGDLDYVYSPQTANATVAGLPAVRTAIPQERPQGSVEATAYGPTKLQRGEAKIPALHVRIAVSNDGDDIPWHLDIRKQIVVIPGMGRTAPMYARADIQTSPDVTIGRHERRVIDLYYPLSPELRKASHLPRFDLQWQVATAERVVDSSNVFDRLDIEPVYAYGYDAWYGGFGPYWWGYDPFFPSAVVIHNSSVVGRNEVHGGNMGGGVHMGGGGGGHMGGGGHGGGGGHR